MNRQPNKVEETAAPYAAKKAAVPAPVSPSGAKQVDDATFKKVVTKIFSERKELLHKLAQ